MMSMNPEGIVFDRNDSSEMQAPLGKGADSNRRGVFRQMRNLLD